MNTPGLRDPVVMRVLSDFYWTAATGAVLFIVRGEMVKNQSNRALCDTILKFGMVLGYGMGITKTTGYKLACPPGGQ